MHYFFYDKNKRLLVEKTPIKRLCKYIKTPFYVYSSREIIKNFLRYKKSFGKKRHLICYAVKANSNLSILSLLSRLGSGADIVSGGELFRAIKAGISPQKIVYSGVGKSPEEISLAIKKGILMFNIESEEELYIISKTACALGKKANISFRVNPDVDPKTHPYISTGMKDNKFGVSMDVAKRLYKIAKNISYVNLVGVSCHIGSQLLDLSPVRDAVIKVRELINELESEGINLRYVDLGGGLGISYKDENPPTPEDHVKTILDVMGDLNKTIILEPGRAIVGNAGALITKILYVKRHNGKIFYVVDAAMNDLIRPSIYGAYHEIIPLVKRRGTNGEMCSADIVGPVCESGDYFAKGREMPLLKGGDYLAILSAGAYGFSMSSNYNTRPRCAEILVKGNKFKVIRRQETISDILRCEKPYL